MKSKCDNCDWHGDLSVNALAEVKDLGGRLEPGREVPSGECPECKCLCYLATPKKESLKTAKPARGNDKI
jgi:hypothetical protein